MLSPDGRCKTFDASANGFVRGEGCGVVVLKRLSDALADGDNVLAVIRGSAVNQDGHAQRAHGAERTGAAGGDPQGARAGGRRAGRQSSYVEAHGTGTPLGDPIEVGALGAVFGEGARKRSRSLLGSVKTNIGHLEAAAGIAGMMKVVLSLRHGEFRRICISSGRARTFRGGSCRSRCRPQPVPGIQAGDALPASAPSVSAAPMRT